MTHATAFTPAEIGGLARRIDRPVVLVGLMGVGKSTVGRRLAALLDTDFIDVDEEIERAADRSVAEIFEAHGEAYFRAGERRVIARLMEERHGVIATGGGAFVDDETRALIIDRGIAVWLIWRRLPATRQRPYSCHRKRVCRTYAITFTFSWDSESNVGWDSTTSTPRNSVWLGRDWI